MFEWEIGLDEIESSMNSTYNASKSTYSNPSSISKAEGLSVAETSEWLSFLSPVLFVITRKRKLSRKSRMPNGKKKISKQRYYFKIENKN